MSRPPSKVALPRVIDARKLVQRGQRLSGILPGALLERLPEAVESVDGDIRAELEFARDQQGISTVSGSLHCTVELQCQRCLQPVSEQIDAAFAWGLVWTEEQGRALPKSLDPVIQEGDELDLYQALEEEILLNLPMVAYHREECVARDSFRSSDVPDEPAEQRENPFKVLEQLKGSSRKR